MMTTRHKIYLLDHRGDILLELSAKTKSEKGISLSGVLIIGFQASVIFTFLYYSVRSQKSVWVSLS